MEDPARRVVVLNSTYEPLTFVPTKRALNLLFKGKASVLEETPDSVYRSEKQVFPLPVSIVLKSYVQTRRSFNAIAELSKRNLFVRDKFICQYCGRHKSELKKTEILTRDHIIPECKGGLSTWENLVTACSTCNGIKGNIDLDKCGLVLRKIPKAPTLREIWMKQHDKYFGKYTKKTK